MKLKAKANKEKKTLEIWRGEELVAEFEREEAWKLPSMIEEELPLHPETRSGSWLQFSIENIENDICPIEEVAGLDFELMINPASFPAASAAMRVVKRDGSREILQPGLNQNFSRKLLYFDGVTNHMLRACLADDLREHAETTPGFEISVCGMSRNIYNFFDENKTERYSHEKIEK